MLKDFLARSIRSTATLVISILLFLIVWGGVLLTGFGGPVSPVSISPFGFEWSLGLGGQAAISIALFLLDVFLLYRMVGEFGFYTVRTSFAPSVFIALVGGSWFLMPLQAGNICLSVMLLALYILMSTYKLHQAIAEYVSAFALLGIITILSPKWMLLVPVCIIGSGMVQSLTFRTFMAAIIGFAIPYWIAGGLLFLFDEMDRFVMPFVQLAEFCPIRYEVLSLSQITAFALLLFMAVPAFFHYPNSSFSIRERARVCYSLLFVIFVFTLAIIVIQPCLFNEFYALLVAVTSFFVTQMLISSHSRFKGIYFLIMLVLYFAFITEPAWENFLIF